MATKNLDLYKLGVVLDASGATKGIAALKDADKQATKTYSSLTQLSKGFKLGLADKFKSELKEVEGLSRSSALGKSAGQMIGGGLKDSIASVFTASNLGSLIGTAIAPGIGTTVGGVIGSAVDAAISKVSGPIMALVQQGVELNKQLEVAQVHYTAFTGSAKGAAEHLDELKKLSRDAGLDLPMLLQADQRLEEFNGNVKVSALELRAAADASRAFGSGAEGFNAIADSLGLIAEKGELSAKTLLKLQRQGVNATKHLSEALGYSPEKIKKLIAQGRIKGDVAAQIIAAGIEVHKHDIATGIVKNTTQGRQDVYNANVGLLAAQGTQSLNRALGDYYSAANSVLGSGGAQQVVNFIDQTIGTLVTKIEQGVTAAVQAGPVVYQQGADYVNARKEIFKTKGAGVGTAQVADDYLNLGRTASVEGLKAVGLDGAAGLADGFFKGTEKVVTAAGAMAQGVIDRTRDVFQTHSPSRVMRQIGLDVQQGLEDGLVDRTSQGFDKWSKALEKAGGDAFIKGVEGIAKRLNVEPSWLLNVMAFESGLNAHAANKTSSARGLIQFMNPTAKSMGLSGSNAMLGMSAVEQLKYVEKYFAPFAGRMHNQGDVYSVVAAGRTGGRSGVLFRAGSKEYNANRGWDANWDGLITSSEIGGLAAARGQFKSTGFTVNDAPVSAANPVPVVSVGPNLGALSSDTFNPAGARQLFSAAVHNISGLFKTEIVPAIKQPLEDLPVVSHDMSSILATLPPAVVPTVAGFNMVTQATATYTGVLGETQDELRKAANGLGRLSQIAGALGEISGLMPSQQVGKKRGLFSKILGIATPFLSLLPGGGLISAIAGIGSHAIGGDWGGVVSGIAGASSRAARSEARPEATAHLSPSHM